MFPGSDVIKYLLPPVGYHPNNWWDERGIFSLALALIIVLSGVCMTSGSEVCGFVCLSSHVGLKVEQNDV